MMVKVAGFWMDMGKVTYACPEPDGLRICFGQDHWMKISNNNREGIEEAVAVLDAAVGCAPVSKLNTEQQTLFSGVDKEGRTWLGCKKAEPPQRTNLERLKGMGPMDFADWITSFLRFCEAHKACPPGRRGKSCPTGGCCDECWAGWLMSGENELEAPI